MKDSLDFCFCCRLIGHQYIECLKYKGAIKRETSLWIIAQASTVAKWARKNRRKEKWSREHRQQSFEMANTETQNHDQQVSPVEGNRSGQNHKGKSIVPM